MSTIIQTDRLLLRFFLPEDGEAFYKLNLDEEVMRYTGDVPFGSIEESENFIREYLPRQQEGFGRMTVLLKSDHNVIGWCGLRPLDSGEIDLGYRFFKKHWGKGYATEAGMASLRYGFENLGLDEIIGRTARENAPSVRVLEKLGMTFWKHDTCEGIEDSVFYRVTKENWDSLKLNKS